MKPLVVIAIGGNSLITDSEHMSVVDQYRAAGETASHIAPIVEAGNRVVVTHGNGPQVGFIMRRSELAAHELHEVPLEVCVADTQGAIGYALQQTLGHDLRRLNIDRGVVTVVTQVEVDPDDPSFKKPSKPIGSFQLTQRKLVEMMVAVNRGYLVALHIGRMKDAGTVDPAHISFGKLDNVRMALEIARSARGVLGANGITLEYPVIRHMNNLESVFTYEGTNEIHTLILGQAITGESAFS